MNLTHRASSRGWVLIALLLGLVLAGCRQGQPTATPAASPDATAGETLPATEALAVIQPEAGGAVRLRGGVEVSLPAQALSAEATVTLRVQPDPPAAPIPRSLLGPAYAFDVADGALVGVALLRLPLPAGVTPDQYDLAPYRWNGTSWERVNSRAAGDALQFGIGEPGIFSLQGTWRQADATLALTSPEPQPGQATGPLTVTGQYRFSALPAVSGEYIQANLLLKQDISGGAGRVTGNPDLDNTIAEATLYFKPDPAQAEGLIDFSQAFEVPPGKLDVAPGGTTRLYAALTVADGLAPTRRLSSGIEFTQVLPIRIIDMAVVRPELANEGQHPLRWHVRLNGETFSLQDAAAPRLALDEILARGGLGDYRFTLEAEAAGEWRVVSNEVAVQLALRPTETPPVTPEAPQGTQIAMITTPTPANSGAANGGAYPPTPTRRPTPEGGSSSGGGGGAAAATATPQVGPTATPAATSTRPANAAPFWADRYVLRPGECTSLHWQVENVISVFLDGVSVTGAETRQVCPAQTTNYTLQIISGAGTRYINLPITVSSNGETAIVFTVDSSRLAPGQCTVLRWRVTDVRAVFLNDVGVAGEASQQICPTSDAAYTLRVVNTDGTEDASTLNVKVSEAAVIDLRFWADQYTMDADTCTTLYWDVQNVDQVYLDGQGVSGNDAREVCPNGTQMYSLVATNSAGIEAYQDIALQAGDPGLTSNEVIAQGIVNEITYQKDLDTVTPDVQSGYQFIVDGINLLFAQSASWSQAAVTLRLPDEFLSEGGNPVSWPINPGQLVEFRAACEGATCTLQMNQPSYLYLRSR